MHEIPLEGVARRLVLVAERGQDRVKRLMLFDQAPDSSARFVETEIDSRGQVEDDTFTVELSKYDIGAWHE